MAAAETRYWLSSLPQAQRRLLEPGAGPLLAPLRSEIFGPQRLAQYARSLGSMHDVRRAHWAEAGFFPRLRNNIAMFRLAQQVLQAQGTSGGALSPAAHWLLDNAHLVNAQVLAIQEDLPRSDYFRTLPVLRSGPLAGLPRIYGVASAFVVHTDSEFDEDLLVQWLVAYQETCELQLGEVWALPTMLRVVLLENLRRLAERLATHKAVRALANRCCDAIERGQSPPLQALLARATQRGVATVFLVQLGLRLQDRAGGASHRVPAAVQRWLQAALPNLAAAQALQGNEQTADNLSVSNAVASLRAIGEADWQHIVSRASPLMRLMLTSALFAAEHHDTQSDTLHGIERTARRSGRSEMAVAQALLVLTNRHAAEGLAPAHAGHWLAGPGRAALGRLLNPPPGGYGPEPAAGRSPARPLVLSLYLLALALGTAAVLAAVSHLGLPAGVPGGALPAWLMLALLAWPAFEAVIALVHRLVAESTRPRRLPRLSLSAGIPPEHRVLVVVPALLSGRAAIGALVHRLELHQLANPEAEAQFALLTDWDDADGADDAGDQGLLDQARHLVDELNVRHPAAAPRFLLLHRRRRYSASERRWIGWERKRGKLEQLIALLAGGPGDGAAAGSPFVDLAALSVPRAGTRYIVTLDSDTQLPPGRLRELVGVAAHPANRPVLGADGRRVVAGYGILQPRLVTPLPQAREDTYFHRLFAGQPGIDVYSAVSSEVYQDLFGEGSFTGKGLLHVQALHAVLGGRLPEDQVLSHDLLEGALARCAAVTDLNLVEDAPFHAEVAASRVHRWTRGDWQLLPILLHSLVRPGRYPLGVINRWKMADNLRRSLVAPVSLVLLVLALAGTPAPPLWPTLGLVLAAFGAGPLMGALAGLVASRPGVARRHFYRLAGLDLLRAATGTLWHLAMLLQHALLALDAIARALWRLLVSQRRLLQWTTAATAQAVASGSLAATLRRHWRLPLAALLLAAGLQAVDMTHPLAHPLAGALLCALWAGAPLWSWLVSRTGLTRQARRCSPADAAYLRGVARDTWRYFERCVSAADHHLPPDNLQTHPHEMLARRTSPTNIGLYLLSVACAQRFGWLDTPELLQRLRATLDTLDRLERHRGHFLNWYDTATGLALPPMYVSTVDSGNLSGHLLAVAQACLELARPPHPQCEEPAEAQALRELAQRCQALAWAPDFAVLYHPRRHLLHIGLRVAEQQLDTSLYDLLASESRLASLLAIAKGDVPVRHWAALGRPSFAVRASAALQSWSGSMFEYLMPALVLAEPQGSVLQQAGQAAVAAQRDFARVHGVPWGISESAHAGRDHTLAYQYAPQGVPALALRRMPADELVVAPYATALAAQVAPHAASLNLAALQALGARGDMGFVEALDYTPLRQLAGQPMTLVHTVMAHHQGMTLVALANVLLDGAPRRWGMADAHIEAVASLLHEPAPREVLRLQGITTPVPTQALRQAAPTLQRDVRPGHHAVEPTQLLSNGHYSVALRANGAGLSRCGGRDVTRWRDDALADACGSFLWLRRAAGEAPVSLSQHPAPDPRAEYQATFHADRVTLQADWADLQSRVTVWVSPEDDIEFRRVELVNRGAGELDIELIASMEPTLADARADEAHPAFAKLFVRVHADVPQQALWLERRPRLATEDELHAVHFLAEGGTGLRQLRYQADRQRWLGRNRAPWAPLAELVPWPEAVAGGTAGSGLLALDTGLDPVCVLAIRVVIAPGASARLCFATAASSDRSQLAAVVDKYRQASHIERAALMSTTLTSIRLRALQMDAQTFTTLQSLTTALMLTLARPAGPAMAPAACDRRLLWRFGISGDRPLLLVSAAGVAGVNLVRSLSQALSLWAWGGVACDLVVVDAEPASYEMALQRELTTLRDRHDTDVAASGRPAITGWHLLRSDALSADELGTLQALARLRLQADGRSLAHHLNQWADAHEEALRARQETSHAVPAAASPRTREAVVTSGRFGDEPGEEGDFVFDVGTALRPARPWINVLANPRFGTQVSEAGGGNTWAVNSRLNQITPWRNDAVADPPSEWLLLQDMHSLKVWCVAASALCLPNVVHAVRHGQGRSVVSHRADGLAVSVTWCVDPVTAVKQLQWQVANHGPHGRRLRCITVCEWMLGAQRSDRASVHTALHRIPPGEDGEDGLLALLATQQERSAGFGGGTAFLACRHGCGANAGESIDWTCDRREFFDARGRPMVPDHLGRWQGGGGDPCAALAWQVDVPAGGAVERSVLLGWAENPAAAQRLATRAVAVAPGERLAAARQAWDTLLGTVVVETPDPLFDALVNRWLLYQAVSCRLWAKAGFYQAGGATGFRDQLQDAMALTWAAPALLRAQILRCAARQFEAGDVLHWWHETADGSSDAGVRTHFSDDLLWLPHALTHYLGCTGDAALLDETVPFIEGPAVPEGAEDLYGPVIVGMQRATVYEHAARTLDRSLRVGAHGLPLMGSGDWNDGMNRVGHQGRGESVWLAWFLCRVVADFGPLARRRGELARAQRWDDAAAGWRTALAGPAWDGRWYARAFFDDGEPLGTSARAEARIDLIAQAWAVFGGDASGERQAMALAAVRAELVDGGAGLIRLLHPPLVHALPSAGYIQAYPPGVRENGGQYSHAGIWALMAQAAHAKTLPDPGPGLDLAWQYFQHLSPAHRAAHAAHGAAYGLEPYVMAGDVCSAAPWVGRGGWSWYTGAAAWMHRAAIESILGLQVQARQFRVAPGLPGHWPRAEITLRHGNCRLHILLLRADASAALAAAAPWGEGRGVQLLHPGQPAAWLASATEPGPATELFFVVPLGLPVRQDSA